jgi:hypothetical protein
MRVNGDPGAGDETSVRKGCPTLQEIEAYIRWATRGKYGLEDVSIFDIRTLLNKWRQDKSDNRNTDLKAANSAFQAMMMAKRPDIILVLQCQGRTADNGFVRLLSSSQRAAGHARVIGLKDHEALVIKGFHPSTYLRPDYVKGRRMTEKEQKLRIDVLAFCFDVAFHALEGRGVQNKVLQVAWEQAIGKRFEPRQDEWINAIPSAVIQRATTTKHPLMRQNRSEAVLTQGDRVARKLRQLANAYEAS